MQPSALRRATQRSASSSVSPATYRDAMRRTTGLGTSGSVRTMSWLRPSRDPSSVSVGKSRREARAKHQTVTGAAPAAARRRAHSRAVAPDVATSSIRSTPPAPPETAPPRGRRGARWRRGSAAGTRLWTSVSRVFRRRPRRKGSPRRCGELCREHLRGMVAAGSPGAVGRGHGGHRDAALRRGQPSEHLLREARAEVIRAAELEREQDRARRAAIRRGGEEPLERGRVEQAAAAKLGASGAAGSASPQTPQPGPSCAGSVVPAGAADAAAEELVDVARRTRQAARRKEESGRGACQLGEAVRMSAQRCRALLRMTGSGGIVAGPRERVPCAVGSLLESFSNSREVGVIRRTLAIGGVLWAVLACGARAQNRNANVGVGATRRSGRRHHRGLLLGQLQAQRRERLGRLPLREGLAPAAHVRLHADRADALGIDRRHAGRVGRRPADQGACGLHHRRRVVPLLGGLVHVRGLRRHRRVPASSPTRWPRPSRRSRTRTRRSSAGTSGPRRCSACTRTPGSSSALTYHNVSAHAPPAVLERQHRRADAVLDGSRETRADAGAEAGSRPSAPWAPSRGSAAGASIPSWRTARSAPGAGRLRGSSGCGAGGSRRGRTGRRP